VTSTTVSPARVTLFTDVDLDAVSHLGSVMRVWHELLGAEGVFVREVLDRAFENPRLMTVLDRAVPGLADHPRPDRLTRYLRRWENYPVELTGPVRYRFRRTGHRWSIAPLSAGRDATLSPANREPRATGSVFSTQPSSVPPLPVRELVEP
jgi:hypothetical protein